ARLLRAARLAARLGFTIAEDTRRQIRQDTHLVASIAPERVRDELLLTLEQTGVTDALRGMDELGLLCEVIPELSDARGVTQPREHYWDVFNHLVETAGQVERLLEGQPDSGDFVVDMLPRFASMERHFSEEVTDGHSRRTLLKLAGLLHDISKPATRTVEASGRIRFLGHDSEGAVVAGRIMRRLRFSRRGVELMKRMVDNHLRPRQMSQKGELPSRRAIYRYYRDLGDAAIDTLYLNAADYLAARGPMLTRDEWEAHCALMDYILNQGAESAAPQSLPKLITGRDIIEEFSVEPGPRIGELLDAVREAQASGEISTREEALELVGNSLESGGGGA
ncbi:MAG: HD domain-containing protein, partial [Chloroflexi bacterium]|nr:HD domain-containing protein [Chloroflexota bacterium]